MDGNATLPGGSAPSYVFALWNLVIRPPRARYQLDQLGPKEFTVYGVRVSREDCRVKTPRGLTLECSHFRPRPAPGREEEPLPVVIYLHGNSSSRLEAREMMQELVARRISLFCYDAAGCGLSDGEYISLGWHERDDLAAVIEYLRTNSLCGALGLWGRSMGAVTALLHADRDHSIGAMCLDSPFASLRNLVSELAQSEHIAVRVPSWLLNAALGLVRMRIRALADFDIEDLVPLEHVEECFVPALFIHGKEDIFIQPSHSEQIHNRYAGDKEMLQITGDHNTDRGRVVVARVVDFFCRAFRHDAFAEGLLPQGAPPPAQPAPDRALQRADLRYSVASAALATHNAALATRNAALAASLMQTVPTPARARLPGDMESTKAVKVCAAASNSRGVWLEERFEGNDEETEDVRDEDEGISSEETSCSSSSAEGLMYSGGCIPSPQIEPLGHSVSAGQLGPTRYRQEPVTPRDAAGKRSARKTGVASATAASLARSLSARLPKCCMVDTRDSPGPVVSC